MAEKKAPRVRYDDLVAAIRPDPANTDQTIMLSGFVGRSETEGNVRIYPDASLSHWYDVAEDDILNSVAMADSPLGGSHLWLKGSANLTPGYAAPATPAEGEAAPAGAAAAPAGVFNPLAGLVGVPVTAAGTCISTNPPQCSTITQDPAICINPVINPVLAVTRQPSCLSTWSPFGCFPRTRPPMCPLPTRTFICPTQPAICYTRFCIPWERQFEHPLAMGDAQSMMGAEFEDDAMMAAAAPATMLGCLPTRTCPPTHMLGCPPTHTCPPTHMLGCPVTHTCPPTHMLGCAATQMPGCPSTRTCPPTHLYGCPDTRTCPPTHMLGCPDTRTCPPTHLYGCPDTRTCPPTHMLGCPDTRTCPPTHLYGCPDTRTCPPTHMLGCPDTRTCQTAPTHGPGCGYPGATSGPYYC